MSRASTPSTACRRRRCSAVPRRRARAFRAPSVVNVSSMSYGSLGAKAIESLNRGAALAGCLQGTGEGGISPFHQHGGDLVWQIGTGYFGCRDAEGRFDLARFRDVIAAHPQVRMVEIKLSQGAKPGLGGLLPAAKVTRGDRRAARDPRGRRLLEPAAALRVPRRRQPARLRRAARRGERPAGRHQVGGGPARPVPRPRRAHGSRRARASTSSTSTAVRAGRVPGRSCSRDHVALPFKVGFSRVYRVFAEAGLHEDIVFTGAGKLGLPENALLAFALGCDTVNVGREAMLSIGCIQAQRCHTGRCPTGVTTNSAWLQRGLDPALKSVRAANYLVQLRKELLQLSRACGVLSPCARHARPPRADRRPLRRPDRRRSLRLRAGLGRSLHHRPDRDHPPHVRRRDAALKSP